MSYDELEKLVNDLTPYEGVTGHEPDELLSLLLSIARSYSSYISTEDFEKALIKELSAIKEDYETNWEWEEVTVTHTETYKNLIWKG